jgi:hypothetical protein
LSGWFNRFSWFNPGGLVFSPFIRVLSVVQFVLSGFNRGFVPLEALTVPLVPL